MLKPVVVLPAASVTEVDAALRSFVYPEGTDSKFVSFILVGRWCALVVAVLVVLKVEVVLMVLGWWATLSAAYRKRGLPAITQLREELLSSLSPWSLWWVC